MKNVVPCYKSCCFSLLPPSQFLSLCAELLSAEHTRPLSDHVLMVWISLTPRHPGETTKLVTLTSVSKLNSVLYLKAYSLAWLVLVCFGFSLGMPWFLECSAAFIAGRLWDFVSWCTQTFLQDIFSWKFIFLLPWWLYNLCQLSLLDLILWSLAQPPHLLYSHKWPELELLSMSGISTTGTQSKKIFGE